MLTRKKTLKPSWSLRVLGVGTICVVLACGRDVAPSEIVGESAHFLLHQDLSVELRVGVSAVDVLAGLEVNWSDTQTLLAMPDGKIDYYLMAENHIPGACESDDAAGCTSQTTIFTTNYVDQHELNHAYTYLKFGHFPLPLLREGVAEALGCFDGGMSAPSVGESVPWREVLGEGAGHDAYGQGRQLVRYLISLGGIETFLRYYGQAPTAQKPDAFAANFATFWGIALDNAWAAMHVLGPDRLAWVYPLCPCSLPPLPTDGEEFAYDFYRHPYFILPDLGSDTLVLTAALSTMTLADCEQMTTRIGGFAYMLVRTGGGYYVTMEGGSATSGPYVADTCDTAAVYDVPTHWPRLGIAARGFTTDATTVFVQLRVANPGHMQSTQRITVCATCADFDGPLCLPQPSNTQIAVQGTFYVRLPLPPGGTTPGSDLWFSP